ncbi:MAG: hypothetical protein R3E11_13175 [Sphingobium sp.]
MINILDPFVSSGGSSLSRTEVETCFSTHASRLRSMLLEANGEGF